MDEETKHDEEKTRITIGWNRQLNQEQTLEIMRSCEQVIEVFGGEKVRSGERGDHTDTSGMGVCFQFDDQGKAEGAFEQVKQADLEGRYAVKIVARLRDAGGLLDEYHGTPPDDDEPLNANDVMK